MIKDDLLFATFTRKSQDEICTFRFYINGEYRCDHWILSTPNRNWRIDDNKLQWQYLDFNTNLQSRWIEFDCVGLQELEAELELWKMLYEDEK